MQGLHVFDAPHGTLVKSLQGWLLDRSHFESTSGDFCPKRQESLHTWSQFFVFRSMFSTEPSEWNAFELSRFVAVLLFTTWILLQLILGLKGPHILMPKFGICKKSNPSLWIDLTYAGASGANLDQCCGLLCGCMRDLSGLVSQHNCHCMMQKNLIEGLRSLWMTVGQGCTAPTWTKLIPIWPSWTKLAKSVVMPSW